MTTILNGLPLAVQSYCFRKFTNEQIVEMLKECGLSALEICNVHLDVNAQPEQVLELYRNHGISFNSFGINSFSNDEGKIRPIFEIAAKAGIKTLGAHLHHDAYELVENLCREYGMKIAIHNHGSRDQVYGKPEQLKAALDKSSENIGLCLDTGWMIDAGVNPTDVVREFAGRIYGIHFKDFSYSEDGTREEAILGEGKLNLPEFVKALKETGFNGYATIEYEGEPDNPVPNVKRCVEQLVAACS